MNDLLCKRCSSRMNRDWIADADANGLCPTCWSREQAITETDVVSQTD